MTFLASLPFCTSTGIRQLLRAKGFKDVPASPKGIRNRVMAHCRKTIGIVKSELKEAVGLNKRFTLTRLINITAEPAIHERKRPLWHGLLLLGVGKRAQIVTAIIIYEALRRTDH